MGKDSVTFSVPLDMTGLMLLTRDQHGDVIFHQFINSKAGRLKVEELKVEIHEYLGMIGVMEINYESDSNDLENYQNFMDTNIETELDIIALSLAQYHRRMAEPVVSLSDSRLINFWSTEFEHMLESYIKIFTYYELAYGEQLLMSDMKEMLIEAKGEIL